MAYITPAGMHVLLDAFNIEIPHNHN